MPTSNSGKNVKLKNTNIAQKCPIESCGSSTQPAIFGS